MKARGKCDAKRRASPLVYDNSEHVRPERPKYHHTYYALSGLMRILFFSPGATRFALAPGYHIARLRRCPFAAVVSRGPLYFPTTSTTNEPGLMLRCGLPPGVVAGVSTNSAALRKIFFVFGSKAMVRALGCVLTGPTSS